MDSHNKTAAALPELLRISGIALQLGLLLIPIYQFDILNRGFLHLMILTLFGFVIHALLPLRYRLPCFLLLSLAGIVLVLGAETGAWLIGLSLLIIGLSYLPLPFFMRVGAIALAGIAIAMLRTIGVGGPLFVAIWPLLGSMFMFRMIIYLYDLRHEKTRPGLLHTLSYFFLLPNVCFPLFPVIDFKRFRNNYYNEDALAIYQRGISWIFRGIYHLIIYRLVYQYGVLDPAEVNSTGDLVQYMLSAFLLYLRVSGFFHLVVGILLLFGFNLPETHHRYYFASSFTDFWRRINIYWKDFMVKIFYYPLYFRLKKRGPTFALVVSTITVFVMTWVLHAYQWYWLRGTLLFEAHDILFWGILGGLVILNSLYENKYGRQREFGNRHRSFNNRAAVACRTVFTFTVICMLWSLWTADSVMQWLLLWRQAGPSSLFLIALVPASVLAAAFFDRQARREPARDAAATLSPARARPAGSTYWPTVAMNSALILVVGLIGSPKVYSFFSTNVASVIDTVKTQDLNERDKDMLQRGYYEQLIAINQQNAMLWQAYNEKPKDWGELPIDAQGPGKNYGGRFAPNADVMFKGARLTTNRWSMRDRDYEQQKPEGTYRIALLGSSHVLGSGVSDDEVFEQIVENRLNAEHRVPGYQHIEMLNFSGRGRSALQHLYALENTVLDFQPDVIFHFTHKQDEFMLLNSLSYEIHAGLENPYPYIRDILAAEGIDAETSEEVTRARLKPHVRDIINWAEDRIVQVCREHGIIPVWVFLPMVYQTFDDSVIAKRIEDARATGFEILSLTGVYNEHDQWELKIAEWDDHPNALAHRLVASLLYDKLVSRSDIIPWHGTNTAD